jgi:MFS family permease
VQRDGFTWDRLTVSCVLSFCLLVAGLSTGLVMGELRDELGLSGVVAAAHGSMFGVGLVVLGILGVRAVGRLGRGRVLWGACVALVLGVVILCLGRAWPVTLAGAAVGGFACATLVIVMPGIVADHHRGHRAAAFAAINGLPGLAGITFSLGIGAVLAAGGSWRWPYALLTLGIGIATFVVVRGGVAVPASPVAVPAVLPLLADPVVRSAYGRAVLAVMVEFPVGMWAVTYLKEVGGASSGAAVALGAVWGLCLMTSRMLLPGLLRRTGDRASMVCFTVTAGGALLMWAGPGVAIRVAGLVVVGMGAGPLYPLAVERLYERSAADTTSLGAIAALSSGTAVIIGPLVLGALADAVGLRHALLVVPVLAVIGIAIADPRRERTAPGPGDAAPTVDLTVAGVPVTDGALVSR